jgi:hypothetical protein
LQFFRFVELAKKRVKKVILKCNEDFKFLFKDIEINGRNEELPEFDKVIHMMALARVLNVKKEDISGGKYIEANLDFAPPKETQIFSDLVGNPIVYNKGIFGKVPTNYQTQLIANNINELFDTIEYDLEERKNYITLYYLHNMIEIYRSQTNILHKHFKDLSGNMNNLGSYLLDFEMLDKELATTKNINLFQNIQSTFDKVKELYTNLNTISKIKSDKINSVNELNSLKINKLDELNPLVSKLDQIKNKISTLQDPDDINYLLNNQ